MNFKKILLLLVFLFSKLCFADVNSTTWTTNSSATNPALGTMTVGGSAANVSLQYFAYGNAGQQFFADWTLIGNNLGTISPAIGMAIGYSTTASVQTI